MKNKNKLSYSEYCKLDTIKSSNVAKLQKEQRIKEYNKNPKCCIYCNAPISYERKSAKFCNSSCAAKYNNQKRKESGWKRTEESKKKVSNTLKNREYLRPCIKCGKIIKSHSSGTNIICDACKNIRQTSKLIKTCCVCNKEFQLNNYKSCRKTCCKKCQSQLGYQTKILNNLDHGGYRQNSNKQYGGYYKGIWCDSRWELAYLIYHLDHNIPIKRCTNYFIYSDNENKIRKYYPDFIINNSTYVEIKGRWRDNLNKKINAVKTTGSQIIVLFKKEIQLYLKYCYNKYHTYDLSILYDKTISNE